MKSVLHDTVRARRQPIDGNLSCVWASLRRHLIDRGRYRGRKE